MYACGNARICVLICITSTCANRKCTSEKLLALLAFVHGCICRVGVLSHLCIHACAWSTRLHAGLPNEGLVTV